MRYQERVANVSDAEAVAILTSPAVTLAASFGARFVRLASNHRIVIVDNSVVTILPPDNYRRQVLRRGMGRFGNSGRQEHDC